MSRLGARSSVAVIEFAAGDRYLGEGGFRGITGGTLPLPQETCRQNRSTLADNTQM